MILKPFEDTHISPSLSHGRDVTRVKGTAIGPLITRAYIITLLDDPYFTRGVLKNARRKYIFTVSFYTSNITVL